MLFSLHGLHIGLLIPNLMIQKKTIQQRIDDADAQPNLLEDCIKLLFFITIIVFIYSQINSHGTKKTSTDIQVATNQKSIY